MENNIDKIKVLEAEYKIAISRVSSISNEMREIIDESNLSGKCFITNKTNNYESIVKLLEKIELNPLDKEGIDKENADRYYALEYKAIKITKYTNSDGSIEYGVYNSNEYICSDKILNEITEEEFVSYFTNATQEISNLLG